MNARPLHICGALLFAATALYPATVQAQIFECTDARGAREYAQVCPPGTVRQRQLQRPDEPPTAAPEAKSTAIEDIEFKKRLQERQDAAAKAAEDRAKSEEAERNCTQARAQLKALVEGQRMQRIDPATGDRINLGDDERAADAARQRALADQWCK
jgi:hypothetical protein